MKTHVISIILLIFLGLSACNKDNGPEPTPSDARNNFTGTWNVYQTATKMSYQVEITLNSSTTDGVYISNFGNPGFGVPAYARVSGNGITLDPSHKIASEWEINGSGNRDGDQINWSYSIFDGANTTGYTAVYTRAK